MLYFMRCIMTGLVKVGYSATMETLDKRLNGYSGTSPTELEVFSVIDGDREDEDFWHTKFASSRHHGEWFSVDYDRVPESQYPEMHRTVASVASATRAGPMYYVARDVEQPRVVPCATCLQRKHAAKLSSISTLLDVERTHVAHVMRCVGGNKLRAASALGVDRRTIYRMLKRHAAIREPVGDLMQEVGKMNARTAERSGKGRLSADETGRDGAVDSQGPVHIQQQRGETLAEAIDRAPNGAEVHVLEPQTRPETGPMVFGDDWTGVFFRGDNAAHFAHALQDVLAQYDTFLGASGADVKAIGGIQRSVVDGLISELLSSRHGAKGSDRHDELGIPKDAQRLRPFLECLPSTPPTTVELVSAKEMEERHILAVLVAVKGNKSKAARVLGFDRRTLYRKLEKYKGTPDLVMAP